MRRTRICKKTKICAGPGTLRPVKCCIALNICNVFFFKFPNLKSHNFPKMLKSIVLFVIRLFLWTWALIYAFICYNFVHRHSLAKNLQKWVKTQKLQIVQDWTGLKVPGAAQILVFFTDSCSTHQKLPIKIICGQNFWYPLFRFFSTPYISFERYVSHF